MGQTPKKKEAVAANNWLDQISGWTQGQYRKLNDKSAKWLQTRKLVELNDLITQFKKDKADYALSSDDATQMAKEVVGSWSNLETIETGLDVNVHRVATMTLEAALRNDPDASLMGVLKPNEAVLGALLAKAPGKVDDAVLQTNSKLDAAVCHLETGFQRTLRKIRLEQSDKNQKSPDPRLEKFNQKVSEKLANVIRELPKDKTDKAIEVLQAKIEAAYLQELRAFEVAYDQNEKSKFLGAIWRQVFEPVAVSDILLKRLPIAQDALSPTYLMSPQHQADQLVNNVALECNPQGQLHYKAREFSDGGAFEFEGKWATQTRDFKKKLRDANKAKPPPPRNPHEAQKHMYFVDRIALSDAVQETLEDGLRIECDTDRPPLKSFVAFAGHVRRMKLQEQDIGFAEINGVSDYYGLNILSQWLADDPVRAVSTWVDADGTIHLALTLEKSANAQKTVSRSEINASRLISLLVVALIDRSANGLSGERAFPTELNSCAGLDIPPYCVWPLEVNPCKDHRSRVSTGKGLSSAVQRADWVCNPVENWMLGWSQVPEGGGSWSQLLEKRFQIVTEQQLQILQVPDETSTHRDGLNTKDALARLVSVFKWSSICLCGIWFAGALSTVWIGKQFSMEELWFFSLAFFLIGLWRFLLIGMMVGAGRTKGHKQGVQNFGSRLRLCILNWSFWSWVGLWVGPGLLLVLFLVAAITSSRAGVVDQLSLTPSDWLTLKDLPPDAVSFRDTLFKGVWALPVLTVGLLRQAFVMLSELMVERGQIQGRLQTLRAIETNWLAGTAMAGSGIAALRGTLAASIARLRTRFETQSAHVNRLFGEKSATNAALVTLFSLLAPLDGMKPGVQPNHSLDRDKLEDIEQRQIARWGAVDPRPQLELTSMNSTEGLVATAMRPPSQHETCATLDSNYWGEGAISALTLTKQAILMANLMDCLELNAKRRQDTLTDIQRHIETQQAGILEVLQELIQALPHLGGGDVNKTYVCLFVFDKHCVQDSQVDVSTEGLGEVAFDFGQFTRDVNEAGQALERLEGTRKVTVQANANPLFKSVREMNDVLRISTKPRNLRIDTHTNEALVRLNEVLALKEQLLKSGTIKVDANITDALTELAILLGQLRKVAGPHQAQIVVKAEQAFMELGFVLAQQRTLREPVTVAPEVESGDALETLREVQGLLTQLTQRGQIVLRADANQVYQEIGMAQRAVEHFAERREVVLDGLVTRPFIDIDLMFHNSGSDVSDISGQCQQLAVRYFGFDHPYLNEQLPIWQNARWSIDGKTEVESAEKEIEAVLDELDQKKVIYVLGLADGQGPPGYNLDLAQRRANDVVKAIRAKANGRTVIPLTLGEHGWLTRLGLPRSEDDEVHRNATVYACDTPQLGIKTTQRIGR